MSSKGGKAYQCEQNPRVACLGDRLVAVPGPRLDFVHKKSGDRVRIPFGSHVDLKSVDDEDCRRHGITPDTSGVIWEADGFKMTWFSKPKIIRPDALVPGFEVVVREFGSATVIPFAR